MMHPLQSASQGFPCHVTFLFFKEKNHPHTNITTSKNYFQDVAESLEFILITIYYCKTYANIC